MVLIIRFYCLLCFSCLSCVGAVVARARLAYSSELIKSCLTCHVNEQQQQQQQAGASVQVGSAVQGAAQQQQLPQPQPPPPLGACACVCVCIFFFAFFVFVFLFCFLFVRVRVRGAIACMRQSRCCTRLCASRLFAAGTAPTTAARAPQQVSVAAQSRARTFCFVLADAFACVGVRAASCALRRVQLPRIATALFNSRFAV